jgi:hypothetical protein
LEETDVRTKHWILSLALLASALAVPTIATGCAVGYQHHHEWNDSETTFYVQWETSTHRDHRDYDQRSSEEQREYWQWRQSHNGS